MSVPAFRRNLVLLLCIAFVAASAATGIFYGLVGSKLRDASSGAPRQPIVVAARNLERGTVMRVEDVKLSTWGGAEPIQGGYTAVEQVAGKTIYNPVQQNEPVTQARLASRDGSDGIGIASGMRAISVHAADSSGVLNLMRAGQRVDVQVVSDRQGRELKLQTLFENLEVLAIHPAEPGGGRPAAPVVTLLVTPATADRLGLADSGARIRLLLRNRLDQSEENRPALTMANLFAVGNGGRRPRSGPNPDIPLRLKRVGVDGNAGVPGRVQLLVRVAAAQPEAVEELAAQSHSSRRAELLQIIPLPPGPESGQMVRALLESHHIEVLSSTRLTAGNNRCVSTQVGAAPEAQPERSTSRACGLRIQFLPLPGRKGNLRVRVQPEIIGSPSTGVASRKMETEIELVDGQSFVIIGLSDSAAWPVLSEQLFAGRLKEVGNRELVVLVVMDVLQPVHTAALARAR